MLFGLAIIIAFAAWFSQATFYIMTAILSVISISFSVNLSISGAIGAWRLRRACAVDWHSQLLRLVEEQAEDLSAVAHIVILPNYNENEQMLFETLDNLGQSPMARNFLYVVLAMEAREGVEAREKAARLAARAGGLFADMLISIHPEGILGEIAGKSSNTQWAFRQALRAFAPTLHSRDPSKVFLTVGDADTLWHPQFFSALTYQALQKSAHERAWSMWQPPVFMFRNMFSVPAITRMSSYGALLFELAGITNQLFGTHLTYSAYSLSLALASHRLIGGWDPDVIAEDHHMFCKCYCAALWESIEASQVGRAQSELRMAIVPKVQLQPVFLPTISYSAESSDGWYASMVARIQQARRHSQGVAELSYMVLQHLRMVLAAGIFGLPLRTHMAILSITWKMMMVHIMNQLHALTVMMSICMLATGGARWLYFIGPGSVLGEMPIAGMLRDLFAESIGGVERWELLAIFGPLAPMEFAMSLVCFFVARDALEGRLTQAGRFAGLPATDREESEEEERDEDQEQVEKEDEDEDEDEAEALVPVAPSIQGSALAFQGAATGSLGWLGTLRLYMRIQWDFVAFAEPTLLLLGFVPGVLAAWSLLARGTKFEYIVAAKPQ